MSSPSASTSTSTNHDNHPITNVVIAGAGPAGLLLAGLLLHRNNQPSAKARYRVTLVEPRPDLGLLDVETELKVHRSWMVGLAGHGLEAIRTLPSLFDKYVADVGVPLSSVAIFLGSKEIRRDIQAVGGEGFIVDRNFVVAAISRYLLQEHGKSDLLVRRYRTTLMYVDDDQHRVLIRDSETNKEEYLSYDLLVGCDGVRSTVREAILKRNFDFELEVTDIFNTFKAVHVDRPEAISYNSLSVLPAIFPNMQGIALPERDGKLNIGIGIPRNLFDQVPPALMSDDPKVVAEYVREHFKAFELVDYDDFAQQWTACRWNRSGMVHCNVYHSVQSKLVLMGDAAHATSPSIGMGMNTALRDAQKFCELLEKFDDDLERVLPEYSNIRVKEGNALSDLALHLYCFDTTAQLIETLHQVIRTTLRGWFGPRFIDPHPQVLIGNPKFNLADVYQRSCDLGIIQKHRAINDRIRQEHFELSTGMLSRKPRTNTIGLGSGCLLLLIAVVGAVSAMATFGVFSKPNLIMTSMTK